MTASFIGRSSNSRDSSRSNRPLQKRRYRASQRIEFGEPLRLECVHAALRFAAHADRVRRCARSSSAAKRPGARHVEPARDFAGGEFAFGEHFDDAAARRVGEGFEGIHPDYIIVMT